MGTNRLVKVSITTNDIGLQTRLWCSDDDEREDIGRRKLGTSLITHCKKEPNIETLSLYVGQGSMSRARCT